MNQAEVIKVIDDLGDWLCTDMEKELVKGNYGGLPSTAEMEKMSIIKDVATRIKWYRDNCIKNQPTP